MQSNWVFVVSASPILYTLVLIHARSNKKFSYSKDLPTLVSTFKTLGKIFWRSSISFACLRSNSYAGFKSEYQHFCWTWWRPGSEIRLDSDVHPVFPGSCHCQRKNSKMRQSKTLGGSFIAKQSTHSRCLRRKLSWTVELLRVKVGNSRNGLWFFQCRVRLLFCSYMGFWMCPGNRCMMETATLVRLISMLLQWGNGQFVFLLIGHVGPAGLRWSCFSVVWALTHVLLWMALQFPQSPVTTQFASFIFFNLCLSSLTFWGYKEERDRERQ
jgi:hypothetical protein